MDAAEGPTRLSPLYISYLAYTRRMSTKVIRTTVFICVVVFLLL